MNQKAVTWLYEQLPELVAKKIIPAESADLLQQYYGPADKNWGRRTLLTMFGIIGVLLIGLGVILILAHNWDQLSRLARTLITVGNLLAAQIFAAFVIWFKKDNATWTESSATLLMLIIGASIALIGQTYHISDDFSNFLLAWMLLSIPIVYVMRATTPALLYLIGITSWLVDGHFTGMDKHLIWILFALSGPYYWKLIKTNRYGNPSVLLSWTLTLCLYICFGNVFAKQLHHLLPLIYITVFAITYLIGLLWFDEPVSAWQKPCKVIGLVGCLGTSFLLTSDVAWRFIEQGLSDIETSEYLLFLSLFAVFLILSIRLLSKRTSRNVLFSSAPIVVGAGCLLSSVNLSFVLMNGYVLLSGVTLIRRGARESNLGILNIGMLLVAALIIMRFFDSNFSFVVRGLIFVVIGICFLATNWIMVRRKKEVTQ